jgi:hypothetical protein
MTRFVHDCGLRDRCWIRRTSRCARAVAEGRGPRVRGHSYRRLAGVSRRPRRGYVYWSSSTLWSAPRSARSGQRTQSKGQPPAPKLRISTCVNGLEMTQDGSAPPWPALSTMLGDCVAAHPSMSRDTGHTDARRHRDSRGRKRPLKIPR